MRKLTVKEFADLYGRERLAEEMIMNRRHINRIISGSLPMSKRNRRWIEILAEKEGLEIEWEEVAVQT